MQRIIYVLLCAMAICHGGDDQPSIGRSLVAGVLGGVVDTYATQPLTMLKNLIQQGRPISLRPSDLWRGSVLVAASQVPTAAVQMGANNLFQRLPGQQSDLRELVLACAAGGISALISCPTEHGMIHRQNTGAPYAQLARLHGPHAFHALVPTIFREAGYAGGYLGLRDICKRWMAQLNDSELCISLGAATVSGIAAGAVTHPADMIKTMMQSDPLRYRRALQTAHEIHRVHGSSGFTRGIGPRMASTILGVSALGGVIDYFEHA